MIAEQDVAVGFLPQAIQRLVVLSLSILPRYVRVKIKAADRAAAVARAGGKVPSHPRPIVPESIAIDEADAKMIRTVDPEASIYFSAVERAPFVVRPSFGHGSMHLKDVVEAYARLHPAFSDAITLEILDDDAAVNHVAISEMRRASGEGERKYPRRPVATTAEK